MATDGCSEEEKVLLADLELTRGLTIQMMCLGTRSG